MVGTKKGLRVALALLLPFIVLAMGLLAAEQARTSWPWAFGSIQIGSMAIGLAMGFLLLRGGLLPGSRGVTALAAYFLVMPGVLFYFVLWFVGFFFGDSL